MLPTRTTGTLALAALVGFCPWLAAPARGQGSYEIQVYAADLVARGRTMVELHTNITPRGPRERAVGVQPDEHALHETLEVTHGYSEWLEVGFYAFTSLRGGEGWQWVGSHVRPRVSVPASWHWPVGVSLSQEIGYQRRRFSENTWTWEIRPIIDLERGPLYLAANLALERALRGPGRGHGFDFSPAVKLGVRITPTLTAGVEYYGDLGYLRDVNPFQQQGHQVFPSVDLDLSPDWEFNAGVGRGLTDASDGWVVKVIVGRRLPF